MRRRMDLDAIVIGSGIGGLTAALTLARAGQRVLVVEQHYLPGGWSHSFTLDGYSFSPGVHYLGELRRGETLRRLFEGLGMGKHLRFGQLAVDGYDHLLVGGERFDLPAGRARMIDRFARRFPEHADGIARYFAICRRVYEDLCKVDQLMVFPACLVAPLRAPALARWGFRTLAALLDACGLRDPLLRAFLCAQCGNHGLAPEQVSLPAHAAMIEHYAGGAYYPIGGPRRIVSAYLKELRAHRGSIRLRTRVERILVSAGRAVGVRLEGGEVLTAKTIVSNADATLTYEDLLPRHLARRQRWRARTMRSSVSALSLFLAVDMDLSSVGYDSGNYWWYRHADVASVYRDMQRQLPTMGVDGLFAGISSLKDPHRKHPGRHTIELFTFVPWEPFAAWQASATERRPEPYTKMKAALTETMFEAAEQVFPGIRERTLVSSLGTPLTNDFYCNTRRGGCYGIAKTRWQVGPFAFGTRSPVPGLYLCGASTVSHGVAGAALSGLFAARDVLGAADAMDCLAPEDGSMVVAGEERATGALESDSPCEAAPGE
jgi:all-trans-retinol 13,14-reductase